MKRAKNKQLKLEDYLRFFDDHHRGDLTVHHLNQILMIHGCRMQKTKGEVMEDLRNLRMVSPRRSTVGDRAAVYPCAPLALDEVKADVSSVGWEECPIGWIVAVGSAAEKEAAVATAAAQPSRRASSTTTSSGALAQKRRKKPKGIKRKRVNTVAAAAAALVPAKGEGW